MSAQSISSTILLQHGDNRTDDTCNDIEAIEEIKSVSVRKIETYFLFKYIENIDIEETLKEIEADSFGSINARWVKKKKNLTMNGQTIFYQCKGCDAKLQLKINNNSQSGSIMITDSEHEHIHDEEQIIKKYGIQDIVKDKIIEYEKMHLKPSQMLRNLREIPGITIPNSLQLSNYLKQLRQTYKGSALCLQDIEDFYENNKKIPESEDEMFVVNVNTIIKKENDRISLIFRIFLTTKRLLSFTNHNFHCLADATYKILVECYPLLTIGTTDRKRQLHHFGYAIVNRETSEDFKFLFESVKKGVNDCFNRVWCPRILIADNAPEIENGFVEAFGKSTEENWRVNCWAHAIRNIDNYISHISIKEAKEKIRLDILQIQVVCSKKIFNHATNLFRKKWLEITDNNASVLTFLNYFNDNWVKKKNGWFEGFQIGIPSQSNALESAHNHDIKAFGNIKQRTTCKRFLDGFGKQVVEEWSLQRRAIFENGNENTNVKVYNTKPVLKREDWENAWKWDNKKLDFCQVFNEQAIYMCGENINKPDKKDCREYLKAIELCDWTDFDTMMSELNKYSVVKFNLVEWELSTCTCRHWQKYYSCNHVLILATRMPKSKNSKETYVSLDDDIFKKIKLAANRRGGRPRNPVGPLSKQPNELSGEGRIIYADSDDNSGSDEICNNNEVNQAKRKKSKGILVATRASKRINK